MVSASEVKCAWATLLTSEHLLPGVVVFAQTLLLKHGSRFPLVIMATAKLSGGARRLLAKMLPGRVILRDIEPIYPTSSAAPGATSVYANARFLEVWTKLRVFDLIEYDRVALVDSDMLVCKNMDNLFDDPDVFGDATQEWIGASWACTCNPARIASYPAEWVPENCGFSPQVHPKALVDPVQPALDAIEPSKLINSGLVILRPSSETMAEMIEVLNTDPRVQTYRFPDQDFLAHFFTQSPGDMTVETRPRGIKYLPWCYNGLKKLRLVHPNIWRDDEVRNVHYILDKPWTLGKPGSAQNPIAQDPDHELHSWWWTAFLGLQSQIQNASDDAASLHISSQDWSTFVEKYVKL